MGNSTDLQRESAQKAMTAWLMSAQGLGKAPAKIKCAGEFYHKDLRYYIFKFKKSIFSPLWLVGVCGGYGDDPVKNCGHILSEMETYNPSTAQAKAQAMVNKMRKEWLDLAKARIDEAVRVTQKNAAEKAAKEAQEAAANGAVTGEKKKDSVSGSFTGFVLLNTARWDLEKLKKDLRQDWDFEIPETGKEGDGDSLVWTQRGMLVAINMAPSKAPDGQIMKYAKENYMWPEAEEVVGTHMAHLVVAVLGYGHPAIDAGKLFVKVCLSCLKQDNAIGLETGKTVFQPKYYIHAAKMLEKDGLPVLNWIYVGLARGKKGINAFTRGMTAFGKDEIEVLESQASPEKIREFLFEIAAYVLTENKELEDGQTIGFSAHERLPITRSEGVGVKGMSIKIGY